MPIYGCKNKQRPMIGEYLEVQDGYHSSVVSNTRYPNMVNATFVMSEDCQYTKTHSSDKLCAGCIHQHKE